MFRIKAVQTPSVREAASVTLLIVLIMNLCIVVLGTAPHIPLLLAIFFLFIYGLYKRVSFKSLELGMAEGAKLGIPAVFLFFFIGILIATWMISGTIPTLVYVGLKLVTPKFYLAIIFVVTAIIGISVGSSLTTVGTVGVAFIGISAALDISLAMTAGAIVSGAFFGDKMSPLSDTTNMSSTILQVDLFAHIKNMMWTTIPGFIISFILFALISPDISINTFKTMNTFQTELMSTGLITWIGCLVPILVLVLFSLKKAPALLALAASSLTALLMAVMLQNAPLQQIMGIIFNGYTSSTGSTDIDELLSRGGMESMFFTITIVLLALSLGGLLFTLGVISSLLSQIEKSLNKVYKVMTASALTAIGINFLIGEQYLSILLTEETYRAQYEKNNLHPINLARVAEDAGTVVNPLVPWSVCGVFITSVLGVATIDYFVFAFFCLLSPILTIFYGFTGKTLTYLK